MGQRDLVVGFSCLLIGVLGCGSQVDLGEPGAACGRVVQLYRGLPSPVNVGGTEPEAGGLAVTISYRGMNDFNAPVEGAARCVFERTGDGNLELLEATVDGQEVPAADRKTLSRSLAR